MKKTFNTKKVALLGIFGALALVLSFLESILIPEIPFLPPGAKIGLSNVVTMLTASFYGFAPAMYITLLKGLFALITRGATAALMSLSGGIISTVGLCLMIKYEGRAFSFFGIGIVCAVLHNSGQLAAACVITGTAMLINYGKYLLVFAILTGSVTGLVLNVIMPRLKSVLKGTGAKSDVLT